MSPESPVRSYVQTRRDWLALQSFDTALEKEFQQHRVADGIGPTILMGLMGGLAFLLVLVMETAENKLFQHYNIYTTSIRVLAGLVLIAVSGLVALKPEVDPAVEKLMFAVFMFLATVFPLVLLFRSTDQNSTSELGLATMLYISAFTFRLSKAKFYIFLFVSFGLYYSVYFGFRGLLSPSENFGPAFDFASRVPAKLLPQGQVFVAFIFAFLMFRLMEARSRILFLREKKLEISNQNRLNLLQAVGHDLRQPMTSILLQQGIAKEAAKMNDQPQLFQSLDVIESGLMAMSNELIQLTEIAALQSDEYVPEIKPVDIQKLLREAVTIYQPEAQNRAIELTFSDHPWAPKTFAATDKQIFSRIANNLISNSIKYSCARKNQPSKIDIAVELNPAAELVIFIRDNGIGIESENLEKIWQPFFQIANRERSQVKGYGLGLTQVRIGIDKLLGHSISCKSKFGTGTEFKICVPTMMPEIEDLTPRN